jgi:hypothetical protein
MQKSNKSSNRLSKGMHVCAVQIGMNSKIIPVTARHDTCIVLSCMYLLRGGGDPYAHIPPM